MWVPNLENIKQVAKNAGLDDIAVTGVEPIVEARAAIEERKRQGLHAGMNFTYGNPERATAVSYTHLTLPTKRIV